MSLGGGRVLLVAFILAFVHVANSNASLDATGMLQRRGGKDPVVGIQESILRWPRCWSQRLSLGWRGAGIPLALRGGSDGHDGYDEDETEEEEREEEERRKLRSGPDDIEYVDEGLDTRLIERELRRRDKADIFSKQTGLNIGVAKTLLNQYNWNLRRALDIYTGEGNPQWRPGETGFDPMGGFKLYGPKDMATDWEVMDTPLEKRFEEEVKEDVVKLADVDDKEYQARQRQPPGVFGLEQAICCNTTWNCVGTAANGIMFDVEAGSADVIITGLECAIDNDRGPVEYVVHAKLGSWLDENFVTKSDPSAWQTLMKPKELELESNPLIEYEDGNVELPDGTFSPLPFDVNRMEGCMGYFRVPKGQRCALYVHGRVPGAVVYRHPVRDLNWDFEETFEGYTLEPVYDKREIVQYRYEPSGSSLIETDSDGNLRIFSGTSLWDADPFSPYCPDAETDLPLEAPCAAFAGVIRYFLANPASLSME